MLNKRAKTGPSGGRTVVSLIEGSHGYTWPFVIAIDELRVIASVAKMVQATVK